MCVKYLAPCKRQHTLITLGKENVGCLPGAVLQMTCFVGFLVISLCIWQFKHTNWMETTNNELCCFDFWVLLTFPERGNREAEEIILRRRKEGRKAEWGVVLAGIKKLELGTVASLEIITAIDILLQRMVRRNLGCDAKHSGAVKAFLK